MAQVKVETTKWWESKTLWFNIITAALLVVTGLGNLQVKFVSAETLAVVALVGNVLLRVFVTGSPIEKSFS